MFSQLSHGSPIYPLTELRIYMLDFPHLVMIMEDIDLREHVLSVRKFIGGMCVGGGFLYMDLWLFRV